MRGPGYRLDLDVRRVWRCPQCGKERRLGGEVTAVACACGKAMQIAGEPRPHGRSMQPLVSRELTVASFALTEEELARPLPTQTPRAAVAEPADAPAKARGRPETPAQQPLEATPEKLDQPPTPADDGFGAGLDDASVG